MRPSDLLNESRIFPSLEPAGKRAFLRGIIQRLAQAGLVTSTDAVVDALMERENLFSTALGNGCAIPHTVSPHVKTLLIAMASVPKGTDFKSIDGQAVHFLFLILSPPEAQKHHLGLLGKLARMLNDRSFLDDLRLAGSDPAKLAEVFRRKEAMLESRSGL